MTSSTTEAELRHKRVLRRGHRVRLEHLMETTEAVLQQQPLPIQELRSQMITLDRTVSELQGYNNYILNSLTTQETVDAELKESGDVQVKYDLLTTRIRDTLAKIERSSDSSSQVSPVTVHQSPIAFPPTRQFARLPQLQLPHFSGDPLHWTTFWDSFDSAIHSTTMPPVDKFNYLKSLLKGVAADAVSGISVCNTTYDTAITMIKQRFGQKQLIINAHVELLISVPRSNNDTINLRKLYDSVEIHIRGLESQGITATNYGALLTPILLSKLPAEIRLILTRKHGSAVGDLNILRDLLKIEIEARELSETSTRHDSNHVDQHTDFTTGALSLPARSDVCVFCKSNNHTTFFRKTFSSPAARRSKIIEEKRCFNCLRQDHIARFCPITKYCQRCDQRHHTSLCNKPAYMQRTGQYRRGGGQAYNPLFSQRQRPYSHGNQPLRNNTAAHLTHNPDRPYYEEQDHNVNCISSPSAALLSTSGTILMQTALAKVMDRKGNSHTVRLLFDTGSQRTYVSSKLTHMLGLKPTASESLTISPFGTRSVTRSYNVTSLTCYSLQYPTNHSISAVIVPTITNAVSRAPLPFSLRSSISKLQVAEPLSYTDDSLEIDVLIGLDYYWDIVKDEVIRVPDTKLTAIPSAFGYLLSGKINSGSFSSSFNALFVGNSSPNSEDFVKNFWESESFDVSEAHQRDTKETDTVLLQFENTISVQDGRYQVRFPWKEDEPKLPTNHRLATDRFQSLVVRLQRKDLLSDYDKIIQQQLQSNFIESVDTAQPSEGVVHYISHHPVIRMDHSTTKVRIVYDASAKLTSEHLSLNDCLHSGPNLLNDIHRLLLEFRTYKIVLLADIEKAFLQVGLATRDRDATRFFWLKDYLKPPSPDNIQVFRFRRVPFGATSSPFLLAATLRHHLNKSSDPIVKSLAHNFYVDNLSIGVNTAIDAQQLYIKAKKSLSEAGMNLREWVSNCGEFVKSLQPVDRAKGSSANVLGVPWNIPDDTLMCKTISSFNQTSVIVTKRRILQVISKVFDPLGLVTPIVVTAKIFIQDLWKDGLDWDNKVSAAFLTRWKAISEELCHISIIKVPWLVSVSSEAELHVFEDASQRAYGAVAYIRTYGNGYSTTDLLCSKSRVAPVKAVTIPRLELIAAIMGCKLAAFIKHCIPKLSNKVQVWSDSQVILHWIKGSNQRLDVFVKNRVKQIRNHGFNFAYCGTHENPADLCTRGSTAEKLKNNTLWWNGPTWLAKSKCEWPIYPLTPEYVKPTTTDKVSTTSTMLRLQVETASPNPPYSMDLNRYSSPTKLLRVTFYCTRFVNRLHGRHQANDVALISEELEDSKLKWLKWLQESSFRKEIALIKQKSYNPQIKELGLIIVDGLVRCRGRFQLAQVPSQFTNPILLPKSHCLTNLVIKHYHEKLVHQGVRHTLSAVRSNDTINLRKLYDSVEIHIRGLESQGITATNYGALLTPILLSKLPAEIRLILTRKHGSAVGDLNILRDLLKIEIEARELSETSTRHDSNHVDQHTDFTTGALSLPARSDVCVFCKSNNHTTFFRKTFSSPAARRSKIIEEKRSFNCLRQDHIARFCPITKYCQRCDQRHHTSLCNKPAYMQRTGQYRRGGGQAYNPLFSQRQRPYSHGNQPLRNNTAAHLTHNPDRPYYEEQDHNVNCISSPSAALLSTSGTILMQTALAKVMDRKGNSHTVRLLFDTGSQRTYVSSKLTHMLGLKPTASESLTISPFGTRSVTRSYNVTSLTCYSLQYPTNHSISAVIVPTITNAVSRAPLPFSLRSSISKLQLAEPLSYTDDSLEIDVLIGLDYYWDIVKDEVIRVPDTKLTAIPSAFGYLLSGKINSGSFSSLFNALFVGNSSPNSEDFVKNFWESESFDVSEAHQRDTKETDTVLLQFENTISVQDGRYQVRFPWKEDEPKLPTNHRLATDRFQSLVVRLQRKDLLSDYDKIIQQQLQSNFIESVDTAQPSEGVVHYISHHPVIRMDHSTTKVRIVYDASAKLTSEHLSLNDCLHSGPNLLNDIHRLLLEFRTYKIVLLADIEKAFLQVGLATRDRDATRFFWLKDYLKPPSPDNIQVFRFRRVPFGATSSPFLLAATLRHHLNKSSDPIVNSLAHNFYVDNLSIGVNTAIDAQQLYIKAKKSLSEAGMNLREWVSNCGEFVKSLQPVDRAKGSSANVLGVP